MSSSDSVSGTRYSRPKILPWSWLKTPDVANAAPIPSTKTADARFATLPPAMGLCLEYFEHTVNRERWLNGPRTVIAMPTIVQLRTQPSEIVPLIALDTHDYVDAFSLEAPGAADATPENWARAALERTGLGGRLLWHGILRLRLDRSPGSIAGWKVGDRGQRWIRLEASSWFMSANVVVYVYDEQVAVATIVRYEHPVGAVVWAVT